jgi:hypothetical protein
MPQLLAVPVRQVAGGEAREPGKASRPQPSCGRGHGSGRAVAVAGQWQGSGSERGKGKRQSDVAAATSQPERLPAIFHALPIINLPVNHGVHHLGSADKPGRLWRLRDTLRQRRHLLWGL